MINFWFIWQLEFDFIYERASNCFTRKKLRQVTLFVWWLKIKTASQFDLAIIKHIIWSVFLVNYWSAAFLQN